MVTATVLQHGAVATIDYRCDEGPAAPAFTAPHAAPTISVVRRGTFGFHDNRLRITKRGGTTKTLHLQPVRVCRR